MKANREKNDDMLQSLIDQAKELEQMTKNQRKILDAARKLFADRGYEASSTADIAKEAGVAEVILFRNFKSKHNLLYHIVAPVFIQFHSKKYICSIQEIFEKGSEQDTGHILKSAFWERLTKITDYQKVLKILLQESYFQPEIKNAIVKYITTPVADSVKKFVRQKKEQGEFRDFHDETVTNLFFYILFGYIFMNHILKEKHSADENELDELLEIILTGLKN